MEKEIRTRFAPSPTGYIHIGNLRTALYSYLIAKHNKGKFILRIEDTDQNRSNKEFEKYIFKALKDLNLNWDEGPDIGGDYGPYRQSERKDIYLKYAKQLVEQGDAYYCFCPECKNDEDQFKEECHYTVGKGYDGHCRSLSKEEINKNLAEGKHFVIRQKIPNNQKIDYDDLVYGHMDFDTNTLDDQVLIKSDGYPTYNFANVIDDHLMHITHIVRGNEYLPSTPKYILLYKSFNWEIPNFIHLPVIFIRDKVGSHKLSKRDGYSGFDNLIKDGYLPEAIINYIMFLGWNPKSNQEIFSLSDLINIFDVKQLHKNTTVLFDKNKLNWFNKYYISKLDFNTFKNICYNWTNLPTDFPWNQVIPFIQNKTVKLSDICSECCYVINPDIYKKDVFFLYDKYQINEQIIFDFCNYMLLQNCNLADDYYNIIKEYSIINNIPFGVLMHIWRVVMSGRKDVLISGVDISELIGHDNTINRIKTGLKVLSKFY